MSIAKFIYFCSIMKSTSILKKKMSKKPGSFILRQSMKNYDNYVIDVCVNQR